MKKRKRKKEEKEKEKEAEIEKVDIKDIQNQDHILGQVQIPDPDARDPDQDQGHIIEMVANPPTTPKFTEEKKEKMLL